MKNIIRTLLLASSFLLVSNLSAQKTIETSFEVSGVCEMCKKRIEAAVDVKGVKVAEYDLESHLLSIAYNPKHISEADLHSLLNEVGHDTEHSKASDEQYDKIHHCCKYREDEDH